MESKEHQLNPERYMDLLYSGNSKLVNVMEFIVKTLHNCFRDGTIKGRLLDVGSGPTIHTIISACNNVQEIYLSNVANKDIEILKQWLRGETAIQETLVQRVCDLENKRQTIEERVNEMKAKVKDVVHIDILSLESLKGSGIPKSYDVITSCFCLDAESKNKEQYISCVKNIRTLLTSGGHFVLIGGLNSAIDPLDDNKPRTVRLSFEELYDIYDEAGFDIQVLRDYSYEQVNDKFPIYVMVAKKIA